MEVKIEASWREQLRLEFEKDYFKALISFIKNEYLHKKIYPPANKIFEAFNLCPFEKLRVVIVGQDPYHGFGQANGLCFSVNQGIKPPPSLQNIFKELCNDLALKTPASGNLEHWATQGVLLLNATLTVSEKSPGSHQRKGWETFTDKILEIISDKKENIVFLLWGKYAQEKGAIIDKTKHLILTAAHPSPFSAHSGFFGCKHFSKANHFLEKKHLGLINW